MNRRDRRSAEKRARSADQAISSEAVSSKSLLAEAIEHHNAREFSEADGYYRRALALDPNRYEAIYGFGKFLLETGNPESALGVSIRALRSRETAEAKALFLNCIGSIPFAKPPMEIRDFLLRAISEPWARPSELTDLAARFVKADSAIGECLKRASAAWPKRLPADVLFGPKGVAVLARDRLLRHVLESAPISDIGLERLLTLARYTMLEAAAAASKSEDEATTGFYCALAQQCFINEYVFAQTEEESKKALQLRDALAAALASGRSVPAAMLTAVAAYFPLHSVSGVEALLKQSWPKAVQRLLARQVREPREELGYSATIPQLTAIENRVSLAVQRQYEENPYPRWEMTAPRGAALPIETLLRAKFPSATIDSGSLSSPDLLVAGCGTGQAVYELAQVISGAKVLAVDISRASLAYAKRKAIADGLKNVEFAQADILRLGPVGRTFDIIECSGVLHHLDDPMEGWRTLVALLKPGGFMYVSLYSELARRNIVLAQKFVRERGYGPSADAIRRCRQDILQLAGNDPVARMPDMQDFYSTSGMRDLLFHVQEQRFALPQIKEFLVRSGLVFLGFTLVEQLLQYYAVRFPDDPARTNLDHWHQFEQENPDTFISMYQFWVQKPRIVPTSPKSKG